MKFGLKKSIFHFNEIQIGPSYLPPVALLFQTLLQGSFCVCAPSQWETTLQCNVVSHCLAHTKNILQWSFYVCAQPIRDDITMQRRLSLGEPYTKWPMLLHVRIQTLHKDFVALRKHNREVWSSKPIAGWFGTIRTDTLSVYADSSIYIYFSKVPVGERSRVSSHCRSLLKCRTKMEITILGSTLDDIPYFIIHI